MRILFKLPTYIISNRNLSLDVDLSYQVGEVRKRLSRIINCPLSSFQLTTSKFAIKILLTDTWPLSFFISEENPIIKVKLLDQCSPSNRSESIPSRVSSLSIVNIPNSNNTADIFMTCCKIGNITRLKETFGNEDEEMLNVVEPNKWGALHYACLVGHSDIVSFLVSKRVNCNKVTVDEWTPLQLCCYLNRIDCLKQLLDHSNVQLNKLTKFRGTGLHLACEAGHVEIVKILLERNACCTLEDHRKKKPMDLCTTSELVSILRAYIAKSANFNDEDFPTPFCSEVHVVNSFSFNDKQAFLFLDLEQGVIKKYSDKEQFLDKKPPENIIRIVDIQDVKHDQKRTNHYGFIIDTSKSSIKFWTKFEELSEEWVKRVKKAIEFIMINKPNISTDHTNENIEEQTEEDSSESNSHSVGEEKISFNSFSIIDEIGSGSFGVVYKVIKIDSGQVYAMKSLSKVTLKKQRQLQYAISEFKIMKQLNHPFILLLHYAFQTDKFIYLVLELCPNGDLFELLQKKGMLDENIARFYLAEIILALEYLHSSNIIYRDLKPANVLLDSEFHVKLADFGLAKENISSLNPSMTMAGSPAYLSPEIISKKGATSATDIYGLGPILYELLTGKTPYYNDDIDVLFQNIKNAKLSFPDHVSQQAKDLILLVMNKDPAKRPQISQIKRHSFFRKLDWEALLAKRIKAPRLGLGDVKASIWVRIN